MFLASAEADAETMDAELRPYLKELCDMADLDLLRPLYLAVIFSPLILLATFRLDTRAQSVVSMRSMVSVGLLASSTA